MSLLMDIQDYLRRYGTLPLVLKVSITISTFEMVEMVMETLRTKGKVRFTKVLPACASGACSGSCAQAPKLDEGKRVPVRVYEWIGVKS